jgi:hypothetical protein
MLARAAIISQIERGIAFGMNTRVRFPSPAPILPIWTTLVSKAIPFKPPTRWPVIKSELKVPWNKATSYYSYPWTRFDFQAGPAGQSPETTEIHEDKIHT